jgi:hypothetical protein
MAVRFATDEELPAGDWQEFSGLFSAQNLQFYLQHVAATPSKGLVAACLRSGKIAALWQNQTNQPVPKTGCDSNVRLREPSRHLERKRWNDVLWNQGRIPNETGWLETSGSRKGHSVPDPIPGSSDPLQYRDCLKVSNSTTSTLLRFHTSAAILHAGLRSPQGSETHRRFESPVVAHGLRSAGLALLFGECR